MTESIFTMDISFFIRVLLMINYLVGGHIYPARWIYMANMVNIYAQYGVYIYIPTKWGVYTSIFVLIP